MNPLGELLAVSMWHKSCGVAACSRLWEAIRKNARHHLLLLVEQAVIEESAGDAFAVGFGDAGAAHRGVPLRPDGFGDVGEYPFGVFTREQEAAVAGDQVRVAGAAPLQAAIKGEVAVAPRDDRAWREAEPLLVRNYDYSPLRRLTLHPETSDRFVAAFLRPPLDSTAFERGFGTLYTAAIRAARRELILHRPFGQWLRLAAFEDGTRVVSFTGANASAG